MASPWMRRALHLAARGRGHTHPNPRVGAVLVRDGRIVGEGYHHRPGEPHAEVHALEAAGRLARGATLYVTLEPCRHVGRTPPCTDAILAAEVERVVVAVRDPHPQAGGGADVLMRQGVRVEFGDGAEDALALNLPFFSWVIRGRPWVTLKTAMSADGRVATVGGESKYFTSPAARRHVHRVRGRIDAVVVGIGTVMADDPRLTVRDVPHGRDPVRVVLDSTGRLPPTAQVLQSGSDAPTLVYTTERASAAFERAVFSAGGEVVRVPERNGRPDLAEVLRDLGERGLLDVLVEGGPTVHGALLAEGLADAWSAYIAPVLFGGDAPGPVGPPGFARLVAAPRLVRLRQRRIGPDLYYEGILEASWKELANRCLPELSGKLGGSQQ